MRINETQNNPELSGTGIYAPDSRNVKNQATQPGETQAQPKTGAPGPAYKVEQGDGIQKPYAYQVQKDEQGGKKISFGQNDTEGLNDAFLSKVHRAFNQSDFAPGVYDIREGADGKLDIKEAGGADKRESPSGQEKTRRADRKEKQSPADKTAKKDEKDDGSSWMIMELIPDPEDPHNPYKATRRIVAQGKGRAPGAGAK